MELVNKQVQTLPTLMCRRNELPGDGESWSVMLSPQPPLRNSFKMSPMTSPLSSLFCFTLLICLTNAHGADWPGWRGAERNGISPTTAINGNWEANPPKLVWMTEGFGAGYASVSVVGDTIFTTGNKDDGQHIVAADRNSGEVKWSINLTEGQPKHGYEGSRCTPTYSDGNLYAVTSNGQIYCVNAENGSIVWSKDFQADFGGKMMSGWGYSESPLVDGENVLCSPGGEEAMIVCLNKRTGATVWKSAIPQVGEEGKDGAGYSSIVVSHGAGVKQYVQLVGRGVIGVRASDGEYLWGYNQVANEVANIPTPVVEGDYVFASSGYGGGGTCLLKLSKSGAGVDAKEVYWIDKRDFQNHHGGMVLKDGYIYAGHKHNEGFPTCLKLETGEIVWGGAKNRGPGKGSAGVLLVGDQLIFRYQNGKVALIKATPDQYVLEGTFDPEFQEGKTWAHPVVLGDKLYLREQDKMMCYQLAK